MLAPKPLTSSWLLPSDAIGALMGLAEHPNAVGEVYNVGSDQEVTILALAQRIKSLTAKE